MKLIRDAYGRIDVLGERTPTPDPTWPAIQNVPCSDNPVWYDAYPLTGGAACVQEGAFEILGDVSEDVIDMHFRRCLDGSDRPFNPAAATVVGLWEASLLA